MELRPLRDDDAESLARHANNWNIWINLRDQFPHPYTVADARDFIAGAARAGQDVVFAIAVEGRAVGTVAVVPQPDIERVSGEIGYWLGEEFWGRGIGTRAVREATAWSIRHRGLTRVFARVFEANAASHRVLEKAGFVLEGRLRRSAIKNGRIIDERQYGFIAAE